MWPNGFGSNSGPFSNNFNQDDYQQLYGGGSLGPQYFDQQSMMQLDNSNGEELTDGDYQPELGFTNNLNTFAQNHSINAQFPSPFVPHEAVQPATPPVNPRDPQMNARAAELKAQLLKKRKERANSATPPVPTLSTAAKQAVRPEALNSILGSLNIPKSTDEKHEQDLNDLISQYSTSKPPTGTAVKQEKKAGNIPSIQQIPPKLATPAKSQVPAVNITKPVNQGKPLSNETNGKTLGSRHTSNGSVSEGEIFEDTIPTEEPLLSTQSKEVKQAQNKNKNKMFRSADQTPRNSREGQNGKPAYTRPPREEPRRRTPPPSPKVQQVSNGRGDRREEVDSRKENRNNQVDTKVEQKPQSEAEKPLQPRPDPREEATRQSQTNGALARVEALRQSQEQVIPSLDDILPHDEDLREWLAITGFFNEPYRKKILNRRRAIAALDAQRDKLLAEMEIEERGGIPAPAIAQPSVASMLPPPIPNKLGGRAESVPAPATAADESLRVVSNKRPYSEVQDVRDVPIAEKTPRIEEKSQPQRAKDDEEVDHRRPRSSGFDSSRRFSASRRDDEDPFRHRYEGRGRSRERDVSPGRRAYENRPPARYHEEHAYDRNDFRDQGHSSYRSNKPFDPDYRGRGRGGRGRGRGDPRDQREYQPGPDFKNDTGFGSRIANNKPYRDLKGFEKGGRGDTRYFIVKSFNEENVLKCIEDSIWTTQVQNGDVFKEAFETCKNVILVFSINKSRAFQGYARMESLPGSVEVPDWQRSINWESTGAFRVKWLVICSTRFHRVGHLKNKFNENQAVLIGKDGQEIEERCGAALIELIDEEADQALGSRGWDNTEDRHWVDQY